MLLLLSHTHHAHLTHALPVVVLVSDRRGIVIVDKVTAIVAVILVERRLLFGNASCILVEASHDVVDIVCLRWLRLILRSAASEVEKIPYNLLLLLAWVGRRLTLDWREAEGVVLGLLGLLWLLAIIDWSSPVKPGRKWVFTLTGSGVSL